MAEDGSDISRVAGMIGAWQTIVFTTAPSEMDEDTAPPMGVNCIENSGDVVRSLGTFQAMENNDDGATLTRSPYEIEKISILQFKTFVCERSGIIASEEWTPQRLDMAI